MNLFKKMPNRLHRRQIRSHIEDGIETHRRICETLLPVIEKSCHLITTAIRRGHKVIFFGNGGSAGDSQHLAAEFVGRYERDRKPLAGIALTTNTSVLTSLSNDYDFKGVFARQLEALAKKGDVAVGISTSGNSDNVLLGIKKAKHLGLHTIVLSGKGGGMLRGQAEIEIVVPSDKTSRIQEAHILIGHIICEMVDKSLLG